MRPDWDTYFMRITKLVATRSSCLRRSVGAVLVKDKRILATGYNGAPAGMAHCEEAGCLRDQLHIPSGERHELCRGLHAEQNAIIQAARQGTEIKDSTLYCTTKMLINAGVTRIVYEGSYPDERAMAFFAEAGVKVEHFVLEEDEQ